MRNILLLALFSGFLLKSENACTQHIFWGDIHCHTTYSDCPAADSALFGPAGALQYARYTANLDFIALTDHAENLEPWEWDSTRYYNNLFNIPGQFVTFHGWEYTKTGMGVVPGGGHKQVIFGSDNVPPVAVGYDSIGDLPEYRSFLAPYSCYTIPHHPAKGSNGHWEWSSMSTDWDPDYVDSLQQPVVEIYQSQGNSEIAGCEEAVRDFQQESSVEAALKRWLLTHHSGYKLGITGSTDDHKGLPGSVGELSVNVDTTEGYSTGGLIAVIADTLTRGAIFESIGNRRCYATSGARILLHFEALFGGNAYAMGQTLNLTESDSLGLRVKASGDTEAIDKILLMRNGDTLTFSATDSLVFYDKPSNWSYYRVKVFQIPTLRWDGVFMAERAWSSPIWVQLNPKPDTLVSGRISYDNSQNTRLENIWVYLLNADGLKVDSTQTNSLGEYGFAGHYSGNYSLAFQYPAPWGGGNSVDAQMILRHFVQMTTLTGIRLQAADTDQSGAVNSIDALLVAKRFTGIVNSFPAGDWVFDPTSFSYQGTPKIKNLKALCTGDVNGSYVP